MKLRHSLTLTLGLASALLLGCDPEPPPSDFFAVMPCRAIDSRDPNQPGLEGNRSHDFLLRGVCGVPADATAVMVNLTVVGVDNNPTEKHGFFTVFDAGLDTGDETHPGVSHLNWPAGTRALANGATVPFASENPNLRIWAGYHGDFSANLLVDVSGYFR